MHRDRAARCCRAARCSRNDGGYSPVEAVIVFPVLLLLVFGVVQFALLWHGRHVAEAAAQNALRSARGYQSTAASGQQSARDYLAQVAPNLLPNPAVVVERTDTSVTVQITADVLSIVPLGLTVRESVTGPVERFIGPAR